MLQPVPPGEDSLLGSGVGRQVQAAVDEALAAFEARCIRGGPLWHRVASRTSGALPFELRSAWSVRRFTPLGACPG